MKDLALASKKIEPQVAAWRRELHQIPELSHDLPKTVAFVIRELEKLNVDIIRSGVGILPDGTKSCGIVAEIKGKKPGKTLAIRADMDALPVKEELDLPFASKNGYMHACGHDAHTAMLLGVVKLISERRGSLAGTVRFIFQPAEETINGATAMVKDGAMSGVDAVIGVHTGSTLWMDKNEPGMLGIRVGGLMASTDKFIAKFNGVGGHGAMPDTAIDPVVMSCHAVCQLQTLISREISPLAPAVITIGMINGGTAFNIIPRECHLEGTLRTVSPEVRKFLSERIISTIKEVAHSMRGSAEVEIIPGCDAVVNNKELVEKMAKIAKETIGENLVKEIVLPTMGGEDFSAFMAEAPGAFFFHCGEFGDERDMPHHNSKFQLNEDTFWSAVASVTAFAMEWQN